MAYEPKKRKTKTWILKFLEVYERAAWGRKQRIIDRFNVPPGTVSYWRKRYGKKSAE